MSTDTETRNPEVELQRARDKFDEWEEEFKDSVEVFFSIKRKKIEGAKTLKELLEAWSGLLGVISGSLKMGRQMIVKFGLRNLVDVRKWVQKRKPTDIETKVDTLLQDK